MYAMNHENKKVSELINQKSKKMYNKNKLDHTLEEC